MPHRTKLKILHFFNAILCKHKHGTAPAPPYLAVAGRRAVLERYAKRGVAVRNLRVLIGRMVGGAAGALELLGHLHLPRPAVVLVLGTFR